MTPEPRIVRHLRIHGRVHGVFFRQWTIDTARRLGVDGWVRNRSDWTVEAVVAGDLAAVDALIAACREGPESAAVTRVDIDAWTDRVEPGFRKLPTL